MKACGLPLLICLLVLGASPGALGTPIIDTSTQGNWIGTYGSHGYILTAYGSGNVDLVSLPTYVSSYSLGGTRGLWSSSTTDARALQDPANPGGSRKANYTFSYTPFDLSVNLATPAKFWMSFYQLDWDSGNRQTRIDNVPGHGPVTAANYQNGTWYRYLVTGNQHNPVTARWTKLSSNAVLSAVTFDAPIDDTTQGDWIGVYGSDGYILPGFNSSSVAGDLVSLDPEWVQGYTLGGTRYAWTRNTTEVRALVNPDGTTNRRATITFDGHRFDFELDVTQSVELDLSLYFLDWDGNGRSALLDFANPLLPDESVADFHNGLWYTVRLRVDPAAPLLFEVIDTGPSNIVLSAIMFDNVQFVPEPSAAAMLLAGVGLGLLNWRLRMRKRARLR